MNLQNVIKNQMKLIKNDGDKYKIERLYSSYKQIMFYEAMDILKDEYLAEDAVHNAFINIIKNLDKIDEKKEQETKNFIMLVTKNTAIDMHQRMEKQKTISFDEIEYATEDISEEKNESLILVAIDSLPSKYSSAIKLKYIEGYSDNEIAKFLNISEFNVRRRISRGNKRLLKFIKKQRKKDRNFIINKLDN